MRYNTMIITNTETSQVFEAILRTDTTYSASDLIITLLREGQEDATTYTANSITQNANSISIGYEIDDITLLDGQAYLLTVTNNDKLLFRDKMSVRGEEIDTTGQFTFIADTISEDEYTLVDLNSTGGDKNYKHNQSSAQSSWSIQHNLGKFPSITVVDSSKNVVVGSVQYIDVNNIVVTFSAAFSGTAYMN